MSFDGASLAPVVARRGRARRAHDAVLRVLGQPRDVPRRLEGRDESRQPAHRRRTRPDHRAATTSRPTRGRSSTRATTPPSRTTSRPSEPERLRDLVDRVVRGGGTQPGVPARRRRGEPHRAHARAVDRVPHRASGYLPGDKVHEVAGPNIAGGFRMVATLRRTSVADRGAGACCASRATGSRVGRGTSPTATCAGASRARAARTPCARRVPPARAVLVADGALVDGDARGHALGRRHRARARRNLGVHRAARVGARRRVPHRRLRAPFPVSDDYAPPAPAPASLVDVTITSDRCRRSTSKPSSPASCATSSVARRVSRRRGDAAIGSAVGPAYSAGTATHSAGRRPWPCSGGIKRPTQSRRSRCDHTVDGLDVWAARRAGSRQRRDKPFGNHLEDDVHEMTRLMYGVPGAGPRTSAVVGSTSFGDAFRGTARITRVVSGQRLHLHPGA